MIDVLITQLRPRVAAVFLQSYAPEEFSHGLPDQCMQRLGEFARGAAAEGRAGRAGWFSAAWILDLDLDYFVPDCESPKM